MWPYDPNFWAIPSGLIVAMLAVRGINIGSVSSSYCVLHAHG